MTAYWEALHAHLHQYFKSHSSNIRRWDEGKAWNLVKDGELHVVEYVSGHPVADANARMRLICGSLLVVLAAALAGAPATAMGQATAGDSARRESSRAAPWRVGVFVGGAHNSPVTRLGVTEGLSHRFMGLDAQTTMLRAGPLTVNYALQLLPIVLIDGRPRLPAVYRRQPGGVPESDHAYAYGMSPFGLELSTPASARVALFGAAAGGGLIFSRPFPVPEAQRINFTLEYGGGALVRIGGAHWIRVGYKYHHLSNAYLAPLNPGVDGNVLYAGYQWGIYLPR